MAGLKMKSATTCLLMVLFLLAAFVSLSSFYNLNIYKSCNTSNSSDDHPPDISPVTLSMPAGNCTCTIDYHRASANAIFTPAISCDCHQQSSSSALGVGNSSSSSAHDEVIKCPECPAPEVRVVEKEVVKEVVKRDRCPGVPWYAEGKEWHFPARFPLCSMDVCFNFSRCENADELLIYTYDLPVPPVRYFSRIIESRYHTTDPEKACLFLVFLDTPSPWPPHPNTLPHWNGGLNHVLVTFADGWEHRNPAPDSIGLASVMGTIVFETIFRAGFDIGIPLPGKIHSIELQTLKPKERKYLAAFRGLRYLGDRGDGTFRSRDSFREMHNGKDVIVATSCNQHNNNLARKEHPEIGVNCDEDQQVYANYTYGDVMNSTFGLVPAGRQPASYRFSEVLSAGTIPVLIADNYVKPFDTLIQWHKCLLQFPTSEMHRIVGVLRAIKEEELLKRQENCLQYYNEFLKDDETLMKTAVRALKARFVGAFPSFTEVRRRKQ